MFLISTIPYTTKYYLRVSLGRFADKTPIFTGEVRGKPIRPVLQDSMKNLEL